MSELNITTTHSTSRSIKSLILAVLVLARIFTSEIAQAAEDYRSCLLYTSDAADDSVLV